MIMLVSLSVQTYAQNDKIVQGKLDNGLEYYVIQNNTKNINYALFQKAGGCVEDVDQKGMAHFIEHVTVQCKLEGLNQTCETFFDEYKIKNVASTYKYKIIYGINDIDASNKAMQNNCLTVVRDWICGLQFDSTEIAKVRGVIYEEWRTSPKRHAFIDHMNEVVYNNSIYVGNDNLGSMDLVQNESVDKFKAYYKKWFNTNNIAIVVSGNVNIEETKAEIKKRFSNITNHKSATEFIRTPILDNEKEVFETRHNPKGRGANFKMICRIADKIAATPEELCKQDIYTRLFNSHMSRRIANRKLKGLEKNFSAGNCTFSDLPIGYKQLAIGITPAPGKNMLALESMMSLYYNMVQKGLVKQEILELKNSVGKNKKITAEKFDYNLLVEKNFMWGQPIYSYKFYSKVYDQVINNFDNNEYLKFCKENIRLDNIAVFAYATGEDAAYDEEKCLEVIYNKENNEQELYFSKSLVFDANVLTKGNKIQSKTKIGEATKYVLSNGLTVISKKIDTKDVSLEGYSNGGLSVLSQEDVSKGEAMVQLSRAFGIGAFNANEVNKYKYLHGLSQGLRINEVNESVHSRCTVENLEKSLQVLVMNLKQIKCDDLTNKDRGYLAQGIMKNRRSFFKPNDEFDIEVYTGDIRLKELDLTYFDGITNESLLEMFYQKFDNAQEWVYAITSNMADDKLEALITKYLGSITNRGEAKDKYVVHNPKDFDDKLLVNNIKIGGHSNVGGTNTYYAYFGELTPQEITTLSFLEKLLKSRSERELRFKRVGVYNVHIRSSYTNAPVSVARINVNFGTAKKNIVDYLDYIDSQFKEISENAISEFEFTGIKRTLDPVYLMKSSFFDGCLNSAVNNSKIDASVVKDYSNVITAEDIQKLAKKMYDNKQVIRNIMK